MHRVVPTASRQYVRQKQRAIVRRLRQEMMILKRAAKLIGGGSAGYQHRTAARAPHIGMCGKATDGALKRS
jgi:hypothetical protein